MQKFLHIFWFEYRRKVFTWRFLYVIFFMPLISFVGMSILFLILYLTLNRLPVGYVDLAGVIKPIQPEQEFDGSFYSLVRVPFEPYASESQARAALDAGKIQAYYLLPPDFRQTRAAQLIYRSAPSPSSQERFEDLVRRSLLADLPAQRLNRLLGSSYKLVVSLPQHIDERQGLVLLRLALPLIVGFGLYITIMGCSGYIGRVLLEEKAGRILEILVTSVSPNQLMLAKVSALICVGLTQIGGLTGLPSMVLGILALMAGLSVGKLLPFDLLTLALMLLIILLTFLLMTVLAVLLSALSKSATSAEITIYPILFIMIFTPFFAIRILATQPGHWLTYLLSFFPLTSAVTLLFRLAFTAVPVGQIALMCLALLTISLALLWLAGRFFSSGALQYGGAPRPWQLARIILKGNR